MMYAQQFKAVIMVQSGQSLYIGGQAGMGKSYLVQQIFEDARGRRKSVQITSTTGIACNNYPQVLFLFSHIKTINNQKIHLHYVKFVQFCFNQTTFILMVDPIFYAFKGFRRSSQNQNTRSTSFIILYKMCDVLSQCW